MPVVSVYDMQGNTVGEVNLREDVFGVEARSSVLHDVVVMHLANRRRGTHDTKTRSEVAGGGRKPWRQKGTGRSRHGSIRSPIWRGGGIIFGPHPRDYSYSVPKKARQLALRMALSDKVRQGNLVVVDDLRLTARRTKEAIRILERFGASMNGLVITAESDPIMKSAVANLPGVKVLSVSNINVYDLLCCPKLVITEAAVARVEEVYGNGSA